MTAFVYPRSSDQSALLFNKSRIYQWVKPSLTNIHLLTLQSIIGVYEGQLLRAVGQIPRQ